MASGSPSSSAFERELLARRAMMRLVRNKMRDFPELNTLIDREENSDELILDAMDITLARINGTPPPVGAFYVANTRQDILLDGIIAELLESAAILAFRNNLAFSTGGFSVQLDQHHNYLMLSQQYYSRFMSSLQQWKVSINHQLAVDGTGGIFSDWLAVYQPARYYFNDLLRGSLINSQ